MPDTIPTSAAAIAEIERIDALIDANRAALQLRLRCTWRDATGAQQMWDRCPDLYAREKALFRERGHLQLVRDAALHREWQAEQRRERAAARRRTKIAA